MTIMSIIESFGLIIQTSKRNKEYQMLSLPAPLDVPHEYLNTGYPTDTIKSTDGVHNCQKLRFNP